MSTQHSRGWQHDDICVYVNRALEGLNMACTGNSEQNIDPSQYTRPLPYTTRDSIYDELNHEYVNDTPDYENVSRWKPVIGQNSV